MVGEYNINYNKLLIILFIISQCIVLGSILFVSPNHYIYDENNFIKNIDLFKYYGFSQLFIKSLKDQSPGPLFQFIHFLFEPFTNYDPIKMRVLNYFFYLLSLILLSVYFLPKEKITLGLFLISSLPSMLTIVGMALTEAPAILMLVISLCLLKNSDQQNAFKVSQVLSSTLGGLFLGIAISGRTQFVLLIPALIMVYLAFRRVTILLYISSALIIPSILFYLWEGLVPPNVSNIQSGINLLYGMLAFSYLFIIIFFVSYSIFKFDLRAISIALAFSVLFIFINIKFNILEFAPLNSVVLKIFKGSAFLGIYKYFAPGVLIFIILFSIQCFLKNQQLYYSNKWQKVFIITTFFICLSCIKSSAQFSSRYVLQTFPFLFIVFIPSVKINFIHIIVSVFGFVLSIFSLYTYYKL